MKRADARTTAVVGPRGARLNVSAMIPTSSAPASSSSSSASESDVTKPAISRCDGWIGSKPSVNSRLAGAGRGTAQAVHDDRRGLRLRGRGRRGAAQARARTPARTPRAVGSTRRSPRCALRAPPGPSIPGIASWRNDGTIGTQFATPRARAARRSARLASSSSGSLNSQRPIASKPGGRVRRDVLGEGGVQGRDRGERQLHERPGSLCKHSPRQRRLGELLRDEVARARTEPRARDGCSRRRATGPRPSSGGPATRRTGRQTRF